MINALDLDYKTLNRNRKVNGERVIQFTVFPTIENKQYFDLIVEEAIVTFKNDEYVIKKLEEKSKGVKYYKEVTAVHKFYVDLINKQQPQIHNGSITFNNYMNMVFEQTGYTFEVIDQFNARKFENLGNDNRLALLQKGLDRFKAEFELVDNNKKARIRMMIGNDTDFQFRYGHNIKTINRTIDTTNLATKIAGTGDPELGITASYTSPNVAIFGEIDAPPVNDERFKSEPALEAELQARLIDEPEVSITIDFVDLRAAGYPYAIPNEGDRIWLIYEPMDDLLIETRILEINEVFDKNEKLLRTEVTLSNHRKSFAGTMFDNVQKQLDGIITDDGLIRYSVLDEAVRIATESLHSAQTELEFNNGIIAREKGDPNRLVLLNSKGLGISKDGGNMFTEAITADGFVLTAGAIGRLSANNIQIGPETFYATPEDGFDSDKDYIVDGDIGKNADDYITLGALYETTLLIDDINIGDEFEFSFVFFSFTDEQISISLGQDIMDMNEDNSILHVENLDVGEHVFNIVIDKKIEKALSSTDALFLNVFPWGDVSGDDFAFGDVSLKKTKSIAYEIPFPDWLNREVTENVNAQIEVSDGVLREDLRLASPLPTALRLDENGITAYTTDPNRYARLDHRGLYIRGGAIQIDGGLPDGQIGSASKWNTQGTYIDNNGIYTGTITANQVQVGFNNVSNHIKLTMWGMETYSGIERTSLLDGTGQSFYRDENYIGHIGTSNWLNDSNYRGLRFGLENNANYMSWGFKGSASTSTYTTIFSWHKTDTKDFKGFRLADDVHIDDDLAVNGAFRTFSSTGYRIFKFINQTFDGADGIALRRGRSADGAALFLTSSQVTLFAPSGNANAAFRLFGGSSPRVESVAIWNRTYTSTTQLLRITENAVIGRSTSSRRYKICENVIALEYAKRILQLNAVSWYDKRQSELHAEYLTKIANGESVSDDVKAEENIVRIGGVIAEDVHDAGLEMYVNYDDENRPDGIAQYLWTLLIPITKNHERTLQVYDDRFNTIENRINNLENELALLKGA